MAAGLRDRPAGTIGRLTGLDASRFGRQIHTVGDDGEAMLRLVIHGTKMTRRAVATIRRPERVWTVEQVALK
jgi:hypothetical protein